ncbi:MAG TPA: TraB/GumN family protein [Gammaproteobacteria bacterium]|nr:TraB/GumN family protein [Gammaproteobacteria bacterium]
MSRNLIFAALLLLLAAAPVHADGKHFLWRVSKGGNSLYIAGSVHVLKPSDYPLPPVMEQAFSGSAGLVEEIDLADLDAEGMQMDMLKAGGYQDGRSLKSVLPADEYRRVAKRAGEEGLDMDMLDGLKPWLVSLTLLDTELAKSGYAAADGADMHFAGEATAQHKPVTGLEQPDYQIGLLAGLPDKDQLVLLQQALDESAGFDAEMQQMLAAWHSGDTAALQQELTKEFGAYPEIYRAMLVTRNQAWMPKLEALLASGKQYFVVVGALHLVGPDGLLDRFRKDGYTVEQL